MRFAGALLLSLPLLSAALRRVDDLKRREWTLMLFREFFRRLAAAVAWRRTELPVLLRQLGGGTEGFSFPALVLSEFERCGDLTAAWTAAVKQSSSFLRPEEASELLAFLQVFESASASVFSERCALAAERFDFFAREARAERLTRTRLILSSGVFGAALLLILLL